MYKKYYKNKHYAMITVEDLIPDLQKKFPKNCRAVWMELDLNTNKFILTNMTFIKFNELMKNKEISTLKIISLAIRQFMEYKLKIRFHANRKTLNSELIKHIAIRCIVKEESNISLEGKHKYELLYGIIHSTGLMQPIHISDNITYSNDLTQLLSYVIPKKSKEIWDIWMNSKFKAKDRKAFHKACKDQLFSMIEINEVKNGKQTNKRNH